jgi:hypothetical protein
MRKGEYRLNVRLSKEEGEYLHFLRRLHGKSIARIIKDWLINQGGPMSPTATIGNEKIAKNYKPIPDNLDDLLTIVKAIFDEHPGKVVDLVVRVGHPITYSYLTEKSEEAPSMAPYDILRLGQVNEYITEEKDPRIILQDMFQKITGAGYYPICFITDSSKIWDWLGISNGNSQEFLYGCRVYIDESLSDSSFILAGGKNILAGVGGLSYGLVYKW